MQNRLLCIVMIFVTFQAVRIKAMEAEVGQVSPFPLHQAILKGDTSTVKSLVDHKAPVNLRDDSELTPLQLTFQTKLPTATRIVIASTLIEAGADMEALDAEKVPLLLFLIKKVDLFGVALLLGYGASLSCTDVLNRTPLAYAHYKVQKSENPHAGEIAKLVQAYVDGRTPIYAARKVTQQEREALIAASRKSALEAQKHEQQKLEHALYMQKLEFFYLQLEQKCLLLRKEINALRKELNI